MGKSEDGSDGELPLEKAKDAPAEQEKKEVRTRREGFSL